MRIFLLLALCFMLSYSSGELEKDPTNFKGLTLNVSIDNTLAIHLYLRLDMELDSQSRITGYNVYYSQESTDEWHKIELLTSEKEYNYTVNTVRLRLGTRYSIRAAASVNNVEAAFSNVTTLDTRDAAAKAPVLHQPRVLPNGTAVLEFLPGEDAQLSTKYTLEYRDEVEDSWVSVVFESDASSRVVLHELEPNRTYEARLSVFDEVVPGLKSKPVRFFTNASAQIPRITVHPSSILVFDPDVSRSLQIECQATSHPSADIRWLVNGSPVSEDNSFYTVTTSIDTSLASSMITGKTRTRSDVLTCVASNPTGEVSAQVAVVIRGPGSPPSSVTVTAERGAFDVCWLPPAHPNGVIKKYVVYYSQNKEEPLSDWSKLDLDGSERSVKLFVDARDAFYVRVQAATEDGPGIISDIVAIERDSIPISIVLNVSQPLEGHRHILDPGEQISALCFARGKPRPTLHFALTDQQDVNAVEAEAWNALDWIVKDDGIAATIPVTLLTSKSLHCRGRNSAGQNTSSINFLVEKPGDAPRNLRVASIDSLHVVFVWETPQYINKPLTAYELSLIDEFGTPRFYSVAPRDNQTFHRLSVKAHDLGRSEVYEARVRAKNEAGFGPFTENVKFLTSNGGPEEPPDGVRVEIDEANTAVLNWQHPNCTAEVESYVIYFTRDLGLSNDEYKSWQSSELPANVSRFRLDHHVGLKPKTFYRVRLAAKNHIAEGPPSSVTEFETANSMLPIPTDLQVMVDEDNTVHISFPAVRDPDDHSKTVQRYKVEIAEAEIPMDARWRIVEALEDRVEDLTPLAHITIPPNATTPSRIYWLRVTAQLDNIARLMQASKPIHFRTGRGKLVTRAHIKQAPVLERDPDVDDLLEFTCIAEGSPAPDVAWFYNGTRVESGEGGWLIAESKEDRRTESLLSRYGVRSSAGIECYAENIEGNATSFLELRVSGPGTAPANIQADAYKNQITVRWQPPEVPNGQIIKYLVYYSTQNFEDLGDWEKLEVDDLMLEIDVEGPFMDYLFRVQAVSSSGAGIISDSIVCRSDEHYEPLELKLVAEGVSSNLVDPAQNVFLRCHGRGQPRPQLFYGWRDGIEQVADDSQMEFDSDTFDFSVTFARSTLRNRTAFCRAENKYENASAELMLVVQKPGDSPSSITWKFDERGRLIVDWLPVYFPNGFNVTYHVYLGHSDVIVNGPPIGWAQNEIPLNVNVTLQIAAVNEFGEGAKSQPILVTTPNGGPRDAPTVTTFHTTNISIDMTWAPPKNPLGTIKNYHVYLKRPDEVDWQHSLVDGRENGTDLHRLFHFDYGVEYAVKVSASNDVNEGPCSEVKSFTTWSPRPPAPKNVSAHIDNGTLYVNVDHDSRYTNFTLYLWAAKRRYPTRLRVAGVKVLKVPVAELPEDGLPSYRLAVTAIGNNQESEQSPQITVTVKEEAAPSPSEGSPKRHPVKEPPLVL